MKPVLTVFFIFIGGFLSLLGGAKAIKDDFKEVSTTFFWVIFCA